MQEGEVLEEDLANCERLGFPAYMWRTCLEDFSRGSTLAYVRVFFFYSLSLMVCDDPLLRACLLYVLYCNIPQGLDVFSHVKFICKD